MKEEPKLFQPTCRALFWAKVRTELIQWWFNRTISLNYPVRNWLFKKLVARVDGKPFHICSPIHFQQGDNTYIGKNFYCGYNFTVLDHGGVYIGDDVMVAPNVTIVTVSHPKAYAQRVYRQLSDTYEPYGRGCYEVVSPVRIGNNVWLAAGCIITPGVTIGDNVIIGAGSVVTKDIPANTIAYGSPCRVIREITDEDILPEELFKNVQDH